jgi:hypothetical protein
MHLTCPIGHKEKDTSTHVFILPEDISLEFSVLLSACRVFLGTEETSCLEALLQQGPDWDRLLILANRHGVMPLLYRSLGRVDRQLVPHETMARLRVLYMQNAARNIRMTGELLRLLNLFEANGVQAIPYKGPALAKQVYGDITLRIFSDLDIIVSKQDVLRAKEILLSEGYEPEFQLNSDQEKALLKFNCEYNFHHPARGVGVEVHWQLAWSGHALDSDSNGMWIRVERTALERRDVLSLSPEDLLMALCIHGAKHCWCDNTMKMICDLAGLICTERKLDWDKALAGAKELRAERILFIGLNLAVRFLGREISQDISRKANADQVASALAMRIWEDLLNENQKPARLQEEISFWLKARESRLDGLNCIMRLALEPSPRDWISMPLPPRMYPVYYLMRPFRLIREYGSKEST